MTMTSADDYRYLWDSSEQGWLLIDFANGGIPLIL